MGPTRAGDQDPRGRRRKPNRTRPQRSVSLPAPMVREHAAAAAAAPPGKDHTFSGQLVRTWERARGNDAVLRREVLAQVGVIRGAVGELRRLLSLPEGRRLLELIDRAQERIARRVTPPVNGTPAASPPGCTGTPARRS